MMGPRVLLSVAAMAVLARAGRARRPQVLVVCTDPSNNALFQAAASYQGTKRFATVAAALAAANAGDGLMVMADNVTASIDGHPQTATRVNITAAEWDAMRNLTLKVYVEFPSALPVPGSSPTTVGPPLAAGQTLWERVVAVREVGPSAYNMSLLHPHKRVDYSVLPAALLPSASLVIAKVAGYDNASLGLPPPSQRFPLLTYAGDRVLVAATQLSHCRTRRFAPTARWMDVVAFVLTAVSSGAWVRPSGDLWTPIVTASYARDEPLPADAERLALQRGVQFYRNARLLPTYRRATDLARIACSANPTSADCGKFARLDPPFDSPHSGDGQLGVFEGLTSDIAVDGTQPQSLGVRCDCVTESSAAFAVRGVVLGNASDLRVAQNLLNYGHIHAGYHQPWAVGAGPDIVKRRDWIAAGEAFGIMSWTTSDNAYEEFYKDDDARGLLGAIVTAGALKSPRWHTTLATASLANLRVTPRDGFGPSSSGLAALVGGAVGTDGWRDVYDSEGTPMYSPHYQSYIWAVYLWAYTKSNFQPFLDRAQAALTVMMENYPARWIPTDNGIAMQRARIILPLAFLVRANDTAQHRQWLSTAVDGLLTRRHCEGTWCAYKEELNHPGWGGSTRVPNNADYGTFEAPLNQHNGDPVSDFLYTSNFALLGLHEAARATGNATMQDAADRLADYIVRLQARSTERPALDGAFFRAFDYEKWEAWASDADIGWGAWSVESGWTQSWLTITLGLRQMNTSVWELGQTLDIEGDFDSWVPVMFPPPPPPPPPAPCLPANQTSGKSVTYTFINTIEQLCAGGSPVHTVYNGTICKGKDIEWSSMVTVDPRPGMQPGACQWSRAADPGDIPQYFGGCGTSPQRAVLPTAVC